MSSEGFSGDFENFSSGQLGLPHDVFATYPLRPVAATGLLVACCGGGRVGLAAANIAPELGWLSAWDERVSDLASKFLMRSTLTGISVPMVLTRK